jgi:hypothetical protein
MKYKPGDKVLHFTGVHGMIVKIFNDTESYWFVYMRDNGNLERIEIYECEIDGYSEYDKFGFQKK